MLRCRVRNNGNSEGRFYVGIEGLWTAREEIKVTKRVFKIRKNSDH